MKAVLLLVGCVVVLAQQPYPCASPQQWSAGYQRIDQVQGLFEWGGHWYDATRNRTAELQFIPGPRNLTQLWVMNLWHLNPPQRIVVNESAFPHTCTKTPIDFPFRYYAVGPNDTFAFEDIIGCSAIPNGYVETTSWTFNWINGSDHHTFTRRGCIPVSRVQVMNNTKPTNVRQDNWFDVVIGITNPQVFVPPAICNVTIPAWTYE